MEGNELINILNKLNIDNFRGVFLINSQFPDRVRDTECGVINKSNRSHTRNSIKADHVRSSTEIGHTRSSAKIGHTRSSTKIGHARSSGKLGHWVCYFKNGDKKFYFDSFGKKPPIKLVRYLGDNVIYNKIRVQNYNQDNCGQLCITVLKLFSDGHTFLEILNLINNEYLWE